MSSIFKMSIIYHLHDVNPLVPPFHVSILHNVILTKYSKTSSMFAPPNMSFQGIIIIYYCMICTARTLFTSNCHLVLNL